MKYNRNSLSQWWDWCRLHRAQFLRKTAILERHETTLLNDMLRKWCQFRLRRLRDRRRKTLDAYVHGQDVRIKPPGLLSNNWRITSHVFNVLKSRAYRLRQRRRTSARLAKRRNLHVLRCAIVEWSARFIWKRHGISTFLTIDSRRQVRLSRWAIASWCLKLLERRKTCHAIVQADKCAKVRLSRWAIASWYLEFLERHRTFRGNVQADKCGRKRIIYLFFNAWWDWCHLHRAQLLRQAAIHERHETSLLNDMLRKWCRSVRKLYFKIVCIHKFWGAWKSLYLKNSHILHDVAKTNRRLELRKCNVFFNAWCEGRFERIKSLSRACKAIGWSNVRVCRHICIAWNQNAHKRRSTCRANVLADKCARKRITCDFLNAWWDQAVRKAYLKSSYDSRRQVRLRRWAISSWYLECLDRRRICRGARKRIIDVLLNASKRQVRMSRWAISSWYLECSQRRRTCRANVQAEKCARKRIIDVFLHAWLDQAVCKVHTVSTYEKVLRRWNSLGIQRSWGAWKSLYLENSHISRVVAKVNRRRQTAVCNVFFNAWYEGRLKRIKSLSRTCKAIGWSNVRVCRHICIVWNRRARDRKFFSMRQNQIAAKNINLSLHTALSNWWIALESGALSRGLTPKKLKTVQRFRDRCVSSQLRKMMNRALWRWSAFSCRQRFCKKAYRHAYHAKCKLLCFKMFLEWAAKCKKCRSFMRAFGAVMDKFKRNSKHISFSVWLLQSKRIFYIRNTGNRLKARSQDQRNTRLCLEVFTTFQDAVKMRKFRESRALDNTLLDYKNQIAQGMRRIHLKRSFSNLLALSMNAWTMLVTKNHRALSQQSTCTRRILVRKVSRALAMWAEKVKHARSQRHVMLGCRHRLLARQTRRTVVLWADETKRRFVQRRVALTSSRRLLGREASRFLALWAEQTKHRANQRHVAFKSNCKMRVRKGLRVLELWANQVKLIARQHHAALQGRIPCTSVAY